MKLEIPIDKETLEEISSVFDDDGLKEMRIGLIKQSERLFVERRSGRIVAVVYILRKKKYAIFNLIGWSTMKEYRRLGIATKLVNEAQKKYKILATGTRNEASENVAKKCGFGKVRENWWVWVR